MIGTALLLVRDLLQFVALACTPHDRLAVENLFLRTANSVAPASAGLWRVHASKSVQICTLENHQFMNVSTRSNHTIRAGRRTAAVGAGQGFVTGSKQLAFFVERKVKPRRLNDATRITIVILARLIDWRQLLVVVRPETLVRWHRLDSGCPRTGSHVALAVPEFRCTSRT